MKVVESLYFHWSKIGDIEKTTLKNHPVTPSLETVLKDEENVINWTFSGSITDDIPLSLSRFKFTHQDLESQINGFMSQPVARPGLSTSKVSFVAGGKSFLGLGQKKSSTYKIFHQKLSAAFVKTQNLS